VRRPAYNVYSGSRTLVLKFGFVWNRIAQFLKNFALALCYSIAEDGEFWAIVIPLLVCLLACGLILFAIGMAVYAIGMGYYGVVLDVHETMTAKLDSLSINPDKWIPR
jgi:hypothetical protein